jgi:hypothetical protein
MGIDEPRHGNQAGGVDGLAPALRESEALFDAQDTAAGHEQIGTAAWCRRVNVNVLEEQHVVPDPPPAA